MAEEKRTKIKTTVKSRLSICIALVVLGFTILIFKFVQLQIIDHDYYTDLAASQQLRDTVVYANRGTIYDRNMNVLARSATVWTVALTPISIDEEDYNAISSFLSEKLDVDYDTVHEKCELEDSYYSIVKRKVDKPVVDEIEAWMDENDIGGITFTEDTKRYYPYGNLASQVLGFVGTDNYGLYGIESYYESSLAGISGRLFTAVNANGSKVYYEYEQETEAQDGYNLVLTIDAEIQKYLEDALDEAVAEHNVKNYACGIIMDVNTGEILAMASKPDFDCNDPLEIYSTMLSEELELITDEDEYNEALGEAQETQWRNRTISDIYEPGSVFKIVTASAVLETGTFSLEDSFYCSGSYQVTSDTTILCARHAGHGHETFTESVVNSCNPAFIEMGLNLGSESFYDYFRSFGMSERTGIDLPNEAQSIYYTDDEMGIVELASCSFGQSNAITPIQMITAMATVANGGYLVQPYVVKEIVASDGSVVSTTGTTVKRQVISEEISDEMCNILEQVVYEGNAYLAGFRLAGKSGTAEKLGSDTDDLVASFCAFAPADDPEIACIILLDGANSYSTYGGTIVGPVVARVMSEVLPYIGVEAIYSEDELEDIDVYVPNIYGYHLTASYSVLQQDGLEYTVVGDGTTVEDVYPVCGSSVPKGSTVVIYTDDSEHKTVQVPDVTGYSMSYIESLFGSMGLNLRSSGSVSSSATAVSQSEEPDAMVEEGTVITVTFVDTSISD